MEHYSYVDFFRKVYGQRGRKLSFCAQNETEFREWKDGLRTALAEKMGIPAIHELACVVQREDGVKTQQSVQELEIVQENGYIRKKMAIETLPGVHMPFYILLPDNIRDSGKSAAILAFPAHGANKDTVAGVITGPEVKRKLEKTPAECYGKEFVKRGYVVLCPDLPGFGERLEMLPAEDASFMPKGQQTPLDSTCKNLSLTSQALGFSLTGLMLWDMCRLLDYVQTLPYVEKERIGCAGFSGGGQAAMWLAAMDDRIRLAVISGYVHGYYESMFHSHLCCCNYFPGLWELADISDICALIAPRPLYIENGSTDVENGSKGIAGPKEQVEKIREAYTLFQTQDNIKFTVPEGGHAWYGTCYDFVAQKL